MPKLTLDDVAKIAGVSTATVSRVINNYPHVSKSVRESVQKVIDETGYQPNVAARSLASNRTNVLGLVIPNSVSNFFTDPYFSRLIEGIAYACNENDYVFSLFIFNSKEVEHKFFPRLTRRGMVDGIIIQSTGLHDEAVNYLTEGDIPFIIAGRSINAPDASYVDVENLDGAYKATRHLIQLGRRRVATITGTLDTSVGMDRLEGYRNALADSRIDIDERLISEGDFTELGSYYATRRLLPYNPDAIFVASDSMALGTIRVLREENISIPEDIALVGFDDLPPAQSAIPPLTTIRQPIRRFGTTLVDTLVDILENGPTPPRKIIFDTELVIRESCGMHS
jgi:LacI family transcriptional regulator